VAFRPTHALTNLHASRQNQGVITVQSHLDLAKVDGVAAEVRALDKQLRAADKEAGQFNSRWVYLCVLAGRGVRASWCV
jgi:hypothetical protein